MRATAQQGPFHLCKACGSPYHSKLLKPKKGSLAEYHGAYEELCTRCKNKALNPPEQDGVEMDGLFWQREMDAVIDDYNSNQQY